MEMSATNCSLEWSYSCSGAEYLRLLFDRYVVPEALEWAVLPAFFLLFIVGLGGNSLVVFVVLRNREMRTVTNVFLVNLALADGLVLLICMPVTVVWDITYTWWLGTLLCRLIPYINTVSVSASVLTLTATAMERHYAICQPFRFKATVRRTLVLVTAIWLVSLALCLPEMIILEVQPHNFTPHNLTTVIFTNCGPTPLWTTTYAAVYQGLQTSVLFCLPLLLISAMYGRIALVLWAQQNPSDRPQTTGGAQQRLNGLTNPSRIGREILARRKAAKMLIAVVVLFFVCYLPTHVWTILNLIEFEKHLDETEMAAVVMFTRFLCYLNSTLNPILYYFMSEKFKKEFVRAVGCCRNRQRLATGDEPLLPFSRVNRVTSAQPSGS